MAVPHIRAPAWRTADFGDGSSRVGWTQALDPGEFKAYTLDVSRELASADNRIETATVTPSGLAVLTGLIIQEQTKDNTTLTLWMRIDPDDQAKDAWSGQGETHTMTVTIEVTDGQRFERDVSLQIKQLGQT